MSASPARRGRPRRDPRPVAAPPQEEILRVAGALFAAKGFARTSTREIARAVGLRQPSLFHYFSSKDDILKALAERALIRPLETLERISASPARPSVKLYLVIALHVRHLCSEPLDLTPVLQDWLTLPKSSFRGLYEGIDRYTRGVRKLVEAAVRSREFVRTNPFTATMAILGMCNWTIQWYRRGGPLGAADVADDFARFALRSLLSNPTMLDDIIRDAREFKDGGRGNRA